LYFDSFFCITVVCKIVDKILNRT